MRPKRFVMTRDLRSQDYYNALCCFRLREKPTLDASGQWWATDKAGGLVSGAEICEQEARRILGTLPRKGTAVVVSLTWEPYLLKEAKP